MFEPMGLLVLIPGHGLGHITDGRRQIRRFEFGYEFSERNGGLAELARIDVSVLRGSQDVGYGFMQTRYLLRKGNGDVFYKRPESSDIDRTNASEQPWMLSAAF